MTQWLVDQIVLNGRRYITVWKEFASRINLESRRKKRFPTGRHQRCAKDKLKDAGVRSIKLKEDKEVGKRGRTLLFITEIATGLKAGGGTRPGAVRRDNPKTKYLSPQKASQQQIMIK